MNNLDQVRVQAAVNANMVDFFKKHSALTQVAVN